MAKRVKATRNAGSSTKWRAWSKADERELKRHSKAKTRVSTIARLMKRTPGALRQKAFHLGFGLGHQQYGPR
jgi:hypothetical protein